MIFKIGLAVAVVLAITVAVASCTKPRPSFDARKLVNEGALLLDVRTTGEFAEGHLPDALNVPVQELARRTDELGPKDRNIVIYCRSGMRSANAAKMLQDAGYSSVYDLGPMSSWPASESHAETRAP